MSLISRVIKDTVKFGEHSCSRCGGSGLYWVSSNRLSPWKSGKCFECNGTGKVVGKYHEYEYETVEEDDIRKGSVYVKEWFCDKNQSLSQFHKYYYDTETDKAYLLITSGGCIWCPKSATISVEEHDKEVEKLRQEIKEKVKVKIDALEKEKESLEKEYYDFISANAVDCSNLSEEEATSVVLDILDKTKDIRDRIDAIKDEIKNVSNLI